MRVGAVILICVVPMITAVAQGALEDTTREFDDAQVVFPGAQGFGVDTAAGRGGDVIHVMNLNPSGPGSLRAALEAEGPRVVVFDVAGVIPLKEELAIRSGNVTVAGQTAPPPGITVAGAGLVIAASDVLVQHLRFRVGDDPAGPEPGGRDGISVVGAPDGKRIVRNVVVDRCSVSWAIDEGMSTWYDGVSDVTFSNCIIAENLSGSLHPKGEHSKGLLIGDHSKRVAVLRNLFAHNMRRNPFAKGDTSTLIVNNLVYNPGRVALHFGDLEQSGPSVSTVIGNVFIPGADTPKVLPFMVVLRDLTMGFTLHHADNVAERVYVDLTGPDTPVRLLDEPEVMVAPLSVLDGSAVEQDVLDGAGAWPAHRDAVDERIVKSVRERSGSVIDSPSEVGGLPEVTPVERKFEVPEDPWGDEDGDGWSNLEERLHELAKVAEGK